MTRNVEDLWLCVGQGWFCFHDGRLVERLAASCLTGSKHRCCTLELMPKVDCLHGFRHVEAEQCGPSGLWDLGVAAGYASRARQC